FSVRLESNGSCDEAIGLVLSKAQYDLDTTQSLKGAVTGLDLFIASSLERVQSEYQQADSAYRLVATLLKALPESAVSKNPEWQSTARFPSLDRMVTASLTQLPSGPSEVLTSKVAVPSSTLIQLYSESLLLHFCGAEYITKETVDAVFEWMEQAFKLHYELQWAQDAEKSVSLDSWTSTTYEVLSVWTALARDQQAGPRFVRFWLDKSGSQANSALGLLFDFAISSTDADANDAADQGDAIGVAQSKLYPQAKRAWSATESQLEKLHLGSELSKALSESISHDLVDLRVSKNPSHLARLANSVFTRICPQSDHRALDSLINRWLLDEAAWEQAIELDSAATHSGAGHVLQYMRNASLGNTALSQAVGDFASSGVSKSFHTLARWSVGTAAMASTERRGKAAAVAATAAEGDGSRAFDVFGLSRFARRAMFCIDFIQLSGGLSVLSASNNQSLSALVLYMTLAYVLLRESLASASSDPDDTSRGTSGVVRLDDEDARLFARVSAATRAIEGVLSDLLSLAVVHGSWVSSDVSEDSGAQNTLLVAASRAIGSLARSTKRLVNDSRSVVGPLMRQIGKRLVEACVLSERPVPEGVNAVTQLVHCDYFDVPAFEKLFPVLASATPALDIELLCLALSSTDIAGDIGSNIDELVRLVSLATKALADLGVPYEEFGEAVESDEYVRSAGFRLLSSLLLVAKSADALTTDIEKYQQVADALSNGQVLDGAMPWVCALLGLDSGHSPSANAYDAKLWDASAGLDWETWSVELAQNPGGEQLFRVLAHHILYSLAWTFPSTFRSWWSGLSQEFRGTSIAVEQFVAKHISPVIVEQEIRRIREQEGEAKGDGEEDGSTSDDDEGGTAWKLQAQAEKPTALAQILEEYDDATVKAASTQVTLTYTVDDSTLEIVVRVPAAYPLAMPAFESVKRVAVTEKRWRGWLVAAQAQMTSNKRLDAVCAQLLGNVGAHFAGVEDCSICYSAVGALDNTLPSKQCKTCKHKFHRMCLFKWFSTSNQSTCPLCRNLF
ncbi:hypothetical protein GGI12_004588, partial [Dipsacomyces acuminosporus]